VIAGRAIGLRRAGLLATPGRLLLVALLAAGFVLAAADPFSAVFYGSYALAGALLVVRRPRNSIGWLVLAIAAGFVGTTSRAGLDLDALVAGTSSVGDFLVAWVASWAGGLSFVGYLALTILFPSGRLPSGRARTLSVAALAVSVIAILLMATAPTVTFNPDGGPNDYELPNRFAILPDLPLWRGVGSMLFFVPVAFVAAGVVAMLVRFLRSSGIERLQMRWLVVAMAAILAGLVFGLGSIAIFGEGVGGYVWVPAILAYPSLPAAIYIAVSRHGLYEIDRFVSRTVAWLVLTALLAGLFAIAIVALQGVLSPVTGSSTLVVAASTLLVAALFQPLRAAVQRGVDRRFNRSRVDAQLAIDAFGRQVRGDADLGDLRLRLLATATTTVEPAAAAVWLRQDRPR
jgi:hypothetical protein